MFGLSKKSNRFIGIDFGTSSIKAVELSLNSKKPSLENYGSFDLSGIINEKDKNSRSLETYDSKISRAIKSLIEEMNIGEGTTCVAMPGFNGLVVLIEFPEMKEEEIGKAIKFEAHKHIPTSLEEVSISWEVFRTRAVKDDANSVVKTRRVQVILVAAPKKEVMRYGNLVKDVGLEMDAVELETFSIARALVGHDKGTHVIIDMGHIATNIILVVNGSVIINRNINVGGNDITESIADSVGVSKARAESLKKENKDILNSKQSSIVVPMLDLIAGEVQRIADNYKKKAGEEEDVKIDSVILSGGTSAMVGIDKYFENILKISVKLGDPWAKLTYDQRLSAPIKKMGASFSAAIGAALRSMEDSIK